MPGDDTTLLEVSELRVSVPGRVLVDRLDMTLQRGEFIAVLGRNGTGKTLDSGAISLGGEAIDALRRQQVAKHLALLPQDTDDIFPATVLDSRFRWESPEDYEFARESLATVGIGNLADRDVLSLSGGERRRLAIAQVLTQAPDVYLLDEPTNHLDHLAHLPTRRRQRRRGDREPSRR
jgi:iron complex transport system ATP-binding protein